MKKAFTMMELIMVIVILGILASIALPKLGGTVSEAALTKVKSEVNSIRNGIISKMTKSVLADSASCPALEGTDNTVYFENVTDGIAPHDNSGITWNKVDDTHYTVSVNGESTTFTYDNTIADKCKFTCNSSDQLCQDLK